ncbi:signal peptidase II [Chloroflexota bacterium]
MQKANRPQDNWREVVFGGIGLLVILADQISKEWIRSNLGIGQILFDLGFFRIVHVYNTGAAFGIFKGHSLTLTIVAATGVVVILFLVFLLRSRWSLLDSMVVRSGIGLVIGGTVGNLIDRLRLGHVTDFIDFKVWPAFNIADSAVTIGVIIVAYCLICSAQTSEENK